MTTTPHDESAAVRRETPSLTRLDDALARGYEPHPDDNAPIPAHLRMDETDPWMVALAASFAEVLRREREAFEKPQPGTHEVERDHLEDMAFALGGPIEYPAGARGWTYWTDPHGVTYRAWFESEATA